MARWKATPFMVVTVTLAMVLICTVGWLATLGWQLHFWVPEGRTVFLGKWAFDGYEFQVWQRKTRYAFEPFADGLFVRQGTNDWQVFCFDIQDNYLPKVELRKANEKVEVFRNGENRGAFDLSRQVFHRAPHRPAMTPQFISDEPPGDWWLRKGGGSSPATD